MAVKWTHEAVEHLIVSVQEHPCLYNSRSPEYLDRVKKAHAWTKGFSQIQGKVAQELAISIHLSTKDNIENTFPEHNVNDVSQVHVEDVSDNHAKDVNEDHKYSQEPPKKKLKNTMNNFRKT
ncbi:uncharacterized protein [Musca autumnalis]|uniref:uncharacterized protein n=1 Tax=Musca autumnalis TaxID=221902 RepID=UPI003CEF6A69